MLPIRDENPTDITRIVTWVLIAIAAYVFFAVQPRSGEGDLEFLYAEATIPCEVVTGESLTLDEIRTDRCESLPGPELFADKSVPFSLLASIFLHGSLMHLLGNLWILFIFGNNIEEEMGHVGFTAFYLAAGVAASMAHVLLNPTSTVPVVGASGAIAGVMGAYLVLHPSARVTSIIPPFFFWPFRVPAFLFLGVWFIGQFQLAGMDSDIAWEAHVGGFVIGAAVAFWLRGRRRRERRDAQRQADQLGFNPSHGPA